MRGTCVGAEAKGLLCVIHELQIDMVGRHDRTVLYVCSNTVCMQTRIRSDRSRLAFGMKGSTCVGNVCTHTLVRGGARQRVERWAETVGVVSSVPSIHGARPRPCPTAQSESRVKNILECVIMRRAARRCGYVYVRAAHAYVHLRMSG